MWAGLSVSGPAPCRGSALTSARSGAAPSRRPPRASPRTRSGLVSASAPTRRHRQGLPGRDRDRREGSGPVRKTGRPWRAWRERRKRAGCREGGRRWRRWARPGPRGAALPARRAEGAGPGPGRSSAAAGEAGTCGAAGVRGTGVGRSRVSPAGPSCIRPSVRVRPNQAAEPRRSRAVLGCTSIGPDVGYGSCVPPGPRSVTAAGAAPHGSSALPVLRGNTRKAAASLAALAGAQVGWRLNRLLC